MKKVTVIILFISFLWVGEIMAQQANSFITSDGETLYYTKMGKGPRLFLLPPGPGHSVNLIQPWADSLSNQFECILLEQRGTGRSEKVKVDSTTINLKRAVLDLEDLRKHLGGETITLCGLSWGSMLSQAYAAFFPNNVKKMVLISSLGPDLSFIDTYRNNTKIRRYSEEQDSLDFWNKQPDNQENRLKRKSIALVSTFYDHKIGKKVLPQALANTTDNPQMSNLIWKDLYKTYDLKSALKNYMGQCIVIKPRQDIVPEEMSLQIKSILPQTQFIIMEQCGHFPDMEKPQEFYAILRKVLK